MDQAIQLDQHNPQKYPAIHICGWDTSFISIYETENRQLQLEIQVEADSAWLELNPTLPLFERGKLFIAKLLQKVFTGEKVDKNRVGTRNTTAIKHRAIQQKKHIQEIGYYNFDTIRPIGYRAKTLRGTRVRNQVNTVSKDFFIEAYVINKKIKPKRYPGLKNMVRIPDNIFHNQKQLPSDPSSGRPDVAIKDIYVFDTSDTYDYRHLIPPDTVQGATFRATGPHIPAIQNLREYSSESKRFAQKKDQSFKGPLSTIYQTFDNVKRYPNMEEKAVMLLYGATQYHSFKPWGKRITAMLLRWFIPNNGILYRGNKKQKGCHPHVSRSPAHDCPKTYRKKIDIIV